MTFVSGMYAAFPQLPVAHASSHPIRMWDIAKRLPALRILEVLDCKLPPQIFDLPPSLDNSHAAVLLKISLLTQAPWKFDDMSALPRTLTQCKIGRELQLTEAAKSSLPDGINHIRAWSTTFDGLPSVDLPREAVQSGPTNFLNKSSPPSDALTSVRFPHATDLISVFSPTRNFGYLTEVTLLNRKPKNLTEVISVNELKILPRTLKKISLPNIEWSDIEPSHWPPALETFVSNFSRNLRISSLWRLPRTLTALDILVLGQTIDQDMEQIASRSSSEYWNEISNPPIYEGYDLKSENAQSIMAGMHFGLPLRLKKLHLRTNTSDAQISICFPPLLKSAIVSSWFATDMAKFVRQLPTSINALQLSVSSFFVPLHNVQIVNQALWNLTTPVLTTLSLTEMKISTSFFPCLPSSLTWLRIYTENPIHVDGVDPLFSKAANDKMAKNFRYHFSSLPAGLRYLDCSVVFPKEHEKDNSSPSDTPKPEENSEPEFNDVSPRQWTHLLPRDLRMLYLRNVAIFASDIANLPPKLTFLSLNSIEDVEPHHLKQLPQKLRELDTSLRMKPLKSGQMPSLRELENLDEKDFLPPLLFSMQLGPHYQALKSDRMERHASIIQNRLHK